MSKPLTQHEQFAGADGRGHLQRQQDAWSIAPSKIAFDGIHDPQDFRDDRQDKLWNSVM